MSIEVNSRFEAEKRALAVVERQRHQCAHQPDQPANRIVGALGIGDMAFLPTTTSVPLSEPAYMMSMPTVAALLGSPRTQ